MGELVRKVQSEVILKQMSILKVSMIWIWIFDVTENCNDDDDDDSGDDKVFVQVNVRVEGSKWREVEAANAKVTNHNVVYHKNAI